MIPVLGIVTAVHQVHQVLEHLHQRSSPQSSLLLPLPTLLRLPISTRHPDAQAMGLVRAYKHMGLPLVPELAFPWE
jgi:hypothetical protein